MYSYLYIFVFLVLIMFLLRVFIPVFIWLLPVIFVYFIVKSIFSKKKKQPEQDFYQYTETKKGNYSSNNSDVIDVDYIVVDEEINTQ